MMSELTAERLREVISYDPSTGAFHWLKNRKGGMKAGMRAGNLKSTGYRKINIDGSEYYEHRLAFLYATGQSPLKHVDHINMDRADNRICNLRLTTRSQNLTNVSASKRNKLGIKGVNQVGNKYRVTISKDRTYRHIGYFDKYR